MPIINSVAPGGVFSGPQPNVLPTAVAQANGAAGASPVGKLLLPNAVTSTVLVPNYNEAKQPPANRSSLKLVTSQPSSSLAAQFIAQSPELSAENVALFTVRQQPQAQQAPVNPYANNPPPFEQRIANAPAAPAQQMQQQVAQQVAQQNIAASAATFSTVTAKPTGTTPVKENISSSERSGESPVAGQSRKLANARASYEYVVQAARHHFTERAVEAVG